MTFKDKVLVAVKPIPLNHSKTGVPFANRVNSPWDTKKLISKSGKKYSVNDKNAEFQPRAQS